MWQLFRSNKWRQQVCSASFVLLAMNSANFQMQGYGVSSGAGTGNSNAYSSHTTVGETSGANMNAAGKQTNPGYIATIQANVPAAPTVTNPAEYYNKLKVVIDAGGNPTDALFAIAASDDAWSTTKYVQNDLTLGAVLGAEDWRTAADWGGVSGFEAIGLTAATTYSFKVKATRGDFTESGWSAAAGVATVNPYLTFDLDVSATDAETAAPYTLSMGDLAAGSVTTATDLVWIDFGTNGLFGGDVFISATTAGLSSASTSTTITSATADLASGAVATGFGLRSNSVSQASGGPLAAASPYNGAADNVGVVNTTWRRAYNSATPITDGRASMFVKAKISAMTPAATDYVATFTLIASATF
jgi:hypothetical protein